MNLVVCGATAMADDAGQFDAFETNLQHIVMLSSLLWLPAVMMLPFALAYLVINAVIDIFDGAAHLLCTNPAQEDNLNCKPC
jgi:hypothetical protein